jgi:N-acetyl sugar amidotransferase
MISIQKTTLITNLKVCSRCIYDERVSSILFDENGICNYCHQIEQLKEEYGTGKKKGNENFKKIIREIKKSGEGKKYDCVLGVSGGTDSSYMLYLAKEWGLKPLAVHYDNTWNSSIATQNIRKVLSALNIDLYTHVINNKESDDIFRSFFLADVAEIEAPTDLALAEVMYRAAWKHKIKYILEGHSYVSEGITPVGRNYFDGKYIRSIHKKFGKLDMKTYPLMTLSRFIFWAIFARIRKIRPFWYIQYNKEEARDFLEKKYDWKYYKGHHLENRMTSFYHSIYLPQKFNTDLRNNTLAALVREGKISQEVAWNKYNEPPFIEKGLVDYFIKRLELTKDQYHKILSRPSKSWTEYPNYKKCFERLRLLFLLLAKTNLVPMSFYLKYCFPVEKKK